MKKWQAALLMASSSFTVANITSDAYIKSKVWNVHAHVYPPPSTSIIVPTLNEERYVQTVLESLQDQNVRLEYPNRFEVLVVDSGSTDRTVEIAKKYAKVLTAPMGKLTARHTGILNAKGKVIVGVDADTLYPPNYLNLILRRFNHQNVVGVSSPRLLGLEGTNIISNTAYHWRAIYDGMIGGRMPGSNSNFLKQAYYEVGGFNLSIDQGSVAQMIAEEEYAFPKRLRKIGKVAWEWTAPSFTSGRRWIRAEKRSFEILSDHPLLYPES